MKMLKKINLSLIFIFLLNFCAPMCAENKSWLQWSLDAAAGAWHSTTNFFGGPGKLTVALGSVAGITAFSTWYWSQAKVAERKIAEQKRQQDEIKRIKECAKEVCKLEKRFRDASSKYKSLGQEIENKKSLFSPRISPNQRAGLIALISNDREERKKLKDYLYKSGRAIAEISYQALGKYNDPNMLQDRNFVYNMPKDIFDEYPEARKDFAFKVRMLAGFTMQQTGAQLVRIDRR